MVLEKTHQEYATYFIRSYTTFKHNSTLIGDLFETRILVPEIHHSTHKILWFPTDGTVLDFIIL